MGDAAIVDAPTYLIYIIIYKIALIGMTVKRFQRNLIIIMQIMCLFYGESLFKGKLLLIERLGNENTYNKHIKNRSTSLRWTR